MFRLDTPDHIESGKRHDNILQTYLGNPRRCSECCGCRKLNPGILVMQSAQDWATKNVPGAIDGTRDRCFLEG